MDNSHIKLLRITCCTCNSTISADSKYCCYCGSKVQIHSHLDDLRKQGATEEDIKYLLYIHNDEVCSKLEQMCNDVRIQGGQGTSTMSELVFDPTTGEFNTIAQGSKTDDSNMVVTEMAMDGFDDPCETETSQIGTNFDMNSSCVSWGLENKNKLASQLLRFDTLQCEVNDRIISNENKFEVELQGLLDECNKQKHTLICEHERKIKVVQEDIKNKAEKIIANKEELNTSKQSTIFEGASIGAAAAPIGILLGAWSGIFSYLKRNTIKEDNGHIEYQKRSANERMVSSLTVEEEQKLRQEMEERCANIEEHTNMCLRQIERSFELRKSDIEKEKELFSHEYRYYIEEIQTQKEELRKTQNVNSSIYAPAEISREDFILIQVYLYKDEEQEKVAAKAKEVDPDAVRKNFTPLDVPVKNGDKVTAHLQMSGKGLEPDEMDIEMIWRDHYTDCQFSVYITEDYKPQSVVGTVTLSINGAPAGRMTFKSKIVDAPRSLYAEIVSHKFNKIFISYSHLDEDKVKFIHQAYEALNVDHFFDRAYLKPGDVYPEKIKNYIASADLFILCWSENAKNSDYVHLEIEDAMKRAYPGIDMDKATLAIHPLDIDPHAELPEEMNKVYNFGRI